MSIARAIMKDAPIIILDEETANVDPENEKELMEAVAELTHDKTVIRSISARFPHRQRLAPTKAGIAQCNFPRIGAITRSFTMLRK